MLNNQTTPPKQVLLRLPDDVAAKLARAVPPRQRNKYLVDLLRQDLEKEDAELVAACEYMNAIEEANPELARETKEWVNADLTGSVDDWDPDFDREAFEREFAIAQTALRAKEASAKRRT
ncbi:hypothetical protein [Rhodoferax sp.]|uniref:hypothetical protein n=1 Tax=Rhodoferax sp. TaxID=50421 RepID=UPI00275E0073|nr:hypothetical protein [Rhodoferax sp.]